MHRPTFGQVAWSVAVLWAMALAVNRATVRVTGDSMQPTLGPGDLVLVRPAWGALRAGDVVVVADPQQPERRVVKRVAVVVDGGVVIHGDHAVVSVDSRRYGPVPPAAVRGVALWRWWPPARL